MEKGAKWKDKGHGLMERSPPVVVVAVARPAGRRQDLVLCLCRPSDRPVLTVCFRNSRNSG